jgi:hypothetical protein
MWYLILILFVHFLADFVFQRRKVGNNKHKSILFLAEHCFVYLIIFLCLLISFFDCIPIAIFSLINFGLHFIVDFITSKLSYYFYRRMNSEKKFWTTIGFDQFLHVAALIITAYYILHIHF